MSKLWEIVFDQEQRAEKMFQRSTAQIRHRLYKKNVLGGRSNKKKSAKEGKPGCLCLTQKRGFHHLGAL